MVLLYWVLAVILAPIFLCLGLSVLVLNLLTGDVYERSREDKT
jgi:hypothetical protein